MHCAALHCASSAATTTIIDTRYDCFCSKRFPTFCAAAAVTTTREVDDEDDSMTSFCLPWLEFTLLDTGLGWVTERDDEITSIPTDRTSVGNESVDDDDSVTVTSVLSK